MKGWWSNYRVVPYSWVDEPEKVRDKVRDKVTDKTPNKLLRLIVANPSITLERIKDVTVNVTVNCIIE